MALVSCAVDRQWLCVHVSFMSLLRLSSVQLIVCAFTKVCVCNVVHLGKPAGPRSESLQL